ncbi:MAG: hypothetical protein JWM95_389 [Gemmatimonadetes bacterium]|nr:hypothetical protein [Gemmatimonadota bacterium]
MTNTDLRRFDLTDPGRGPWYVVQNVKNRSMDVKNRKTRYSHPVFYGTRTKRTEDDATTQAIALCALLNFLKAKRP